MATPNTYKSLAQRVKRHIANGFPNSSFPVSDNELWLYIDQVVAFAMVGQTYANAKIEGSLAVPDAYITTVSLPTLQQNPNTNEWYTTLPQLPVSLPLGHNIRTAYFADSVNGKGLSISLIKGHRVAYRNDMPSSPKARAYFEGNTMFITVPDGSSPLGLTLYVTMVSTKSDNINDEMMIPPDVVEAVFTNIVGKIAQRMAMPIDVVADDLPAGKTNIT